jgi:branched-chain amino acid transport system substrate-binding protein
MQLTQRLTGPGGSRRWISWCALIAGAAIVLTGCGSDSATKSTSTANTADQGTARATGRPILFGYVNTEGGGAAISLPEYTVGTEAAVKYVNEHGGIHGRPLKLVKCTTDGSPESSVNCANQMVTRRVVGVLEGNDIGTDAKIPILTSARIPLVGETTVGIGESANRNAFFYSPPLTAFYQASFQAIRLAHVSKVAFITPQFAGLDQQLKASVNPAAAAAGVKLNVLRYNPAGADFTALISTALADRVNGIAISAPEADCVNLMAAKATVGFKYPILAAGCSQFLGKLKPAQTQGAVILSPFWTPDASKFAPARARSDLATYANALKAAGKSQLASNSLTQYGFAGVMNLAAVLRGINGQITAESVRSAHAALKNLPGFAADTLSCDPRPWPGTSGCATSWLALVAQADGSLKPLNGGYLELPGARTT